MTTISIGGRITAIEVESAGFGYAEYTGGLAASPTTIDPTGERLSVIKLHSPTVPDGSGGFVVAGAYQIASSFDVNDIVELFADSGGTVSGLVSGAGVSIGGPGNAVRCRKIASGTATDWIVVL